MAATSSSTPSPAVSIPTAAELIKQIKSHEISLAELNNLPSSRKGELESLSKTMGVFLQTQVIATIENAVYQKNGNLYFRTSIQQATTAEERQLDVAKAKLQKLNSP